MFIETRMKGNQKKFYLAHSFRVRGKPRKIRRYLGANLSKDALKRLRVRAEAHLREQIREYGQISDPFRTVLSSEEISQLQSFDIPELLKVAHLSAQEWKEFTERFTYDTNAIEGSTVTLTEVKQIVQKHEWPKEASKEDISETYGVASAIELIRKEKTHISLEFIKKLHAVVFQNSKPYAGKLRPKGVEVAVKTASGEIVHRGAPSAKVPVLLQEIVKWYQDNKEKYPPLVLAIIVHNQFETIHPFQDGNGRVGRLLLNNILLKHNLPPVNIRLSNRSQYYAALQAYQREGNVRPTIDLVLKEYRHMKKHHKKR
jgi:Fic family protein